MSTHLRIITLLGSVLAGVVLIAPTLTSAALPEPTKAKVKPFKSMDGVKLGMGKSEAIAKWGAPNVCALEDDTQQETCVWLDEGNTDLPPEGAGVQISPGGVVCGMMIQAGIKRPSGDLSITGLKKWDTKEGVGLGSKMKKAKKVMGGETIKEKNGVTTSFISASTDNKKVGRININEEDCLVT